MKNCCCGNIWKAIPLAFNDSLSYLEMLCSLLDKVNTIDLELENQSNLIAKHTEELAELTDKLKTAVLELNKTIADNYTLITNETDVKIKELIDLINLFNNSINTIIETKYNELNDKIKDLQIGRINVYDPTTGKFTYIDIVINNVYDMLRFNAITAGEFDALALTAETYDNKNLTAYAFDINGKVELTRG